MSDDIVKALGMTSEDATHDADCEHFREAAMLAARVMQAEDEVERLRKSRDDWHGACLDVRAERDRERERADRLAEEPPRGTKATWIWDDSPPEDFGQLYMPVCRVCGRGPLTGDELMTGLCGVGSCGLDSDGASEPEVQVACDRCTQGVMDADNPHLTGVCRCACHADGDGEPEGQP